MMYKLYIHLYPINNNSTTNDPPPPTTKLTSNATAKPNATNRVPRSKITKGGGGAKSGGTQGKRTPRKG